MKRRKDFSYGVIPLRKHQGVWQTLLVKHGKGHWAFPKGHAEPNEKALQTAERELKEETGLSIVEWLEEPPVEEHYYFRWEGVLIEKMVVYYLAIVTGEILLQEDEVSDARWIPVEKAATLATFPASKKICEELFSRFS